MLWIDKNTNINIQVNIVPLIDDADFKTIETGIVFNEAGMDLKWNFITTDGIPSQTDVTPTTGGGDYDWAHAGGGIYTIGVPASGGADINNDTAGFGWFTGICAGVLVWKSPLYGIRGYKLNDSLVDDGSAIALQNTLENVQALFRQYSVVHGYTKKGGIEVKRSTDIRFEVFGVGGLVGRTKLYFTVKKMSEKDSAADAQSIIQIEETAGLLYINKNKAGTPANGSIVVTDAAAGTMTITLAAEESNKLAPNEAYIYDIKMDNTVMAEGRFLVSTAITRTIT